MQANKATRTVTTRAELTGRSCASNELNVAIQVDAVMREKYTNLVAARVDIVIRQTATERQNMPVYFYLCTPVNSVALDVALTSALSCLYAADLT